jgi:hypothetical protein
VKAEIQPKQPSVKGPAETFTGDVLRRPARRVSANADPAELAAIQARYGISRA